MTLMDSGPLPGRPSGGFHAPWLCPPGLLHDAPYDPCVLYPAAALALVLYSTIWGAWAWRRLSSLGYIRLPMSGAEAAAGDHHPLTGVRKAKPGLLTCIRWCLTSITVLLAIDLVTLTVIGGSRGVWVGVMYAWSLVALFAFGINRFVFNEEVKKTEAFSWMTAGYWLVYLITETFAFSNWIMNALSNAISVIDPFDEYLFASWMLRYILVMLLVVTAFIVHPYTRSAPFNPADAQASRSRSATGGAQGTASLMKSATAKLRTLLPFLWPVNRPGLQLLVGLALVCLFAGRVIVVLTPMQYKEILNELTEYRFPTRAILLFCAFRFMQSGMLSNLQSFLWLPVGQYTTRHLSVRMFQHLHSLSLRWHVNRKTGEVLRVLDRGTSSIVSLLQMLLFTLLPVVADISIAIIYFIVEFDIYFGVIVIVTMAAYIFLTVLITEWRTAFRREMIELDNRTSQIGVDSLLNYETVKYYGAEQFEIQRYDKAIANYNKADFKSSASLQLLNVSQNLVITLGLLVGLLLCAYRVTHHQLTVGDLALFVTYLLQLAGPLNWFGTMYRVIQQNFIDMEKLLALFDEDADVKDVPGAKPLVLQGGNVEFHDVSFSYGEGQTALSNLVLNIPAGKTVALVGESGGGKSTLLKLLFRFHDVTSGRITVDGQDLRQVTQTSLRQAIGVVPQDPVMFNDTLIYNIRYARPTATDEEVHAAARAAQIHDKIMTFPKAYETVVGERGLRLSGGERQRVAIARTILKNPSLILLDEATSALDSSTERLIQAALQELCKDKTTLVIAHRLSTIMSADAIAVLKSGQVVELGTHEELLAKGEGGLYHELWHKQLRNEGAVGLGVSSTPQSAAASPAATPVMPHHGHH